MRRLDGEVLRESGFQVDTARNGLAALHSLKTSHYDLLIIEEEMSMVPGMELVKKLRSEEVMVPVILVLGSMPTKESKRNPWPQIQGILLKPYTVAELFKTVSAVLRASRGGAHMRFAPPSNCQGADFKRWFADLNV